MTDAHSCLAEIEALSQETSSDKRRQVLNRVADLFVITNDQQSQSDVKAFGTVMDRIAYELEVEARAELAGRLCEIDKAPRDLICKLASDNITVARPVLERSSVLTDDDLVRIAKTKDQSYLHAISKRSTLSSPVTDVIVERGEGDVLVEVTRNKGAQFSNAGLGVLAEKARQDGNLLTALGSRADLPKDLMAEIKQRVAKRIKREMGDRYSDEDRADVDTLIDKTAENIDIDEFRKSNADIQERARTRQLSEDDLVALAKSGRLSETVHALAVMTGLEHRMISHCFLKADVAALSIVCKANDFKAQTFLAFLQTRTGQDGIDAGGIAQAMREYDRLSKPNAMRTLRYLKMRNTVSQNAAEPQKTSQMQSQAQPQAAGNAAISV